MLSYAVCLRPGGQYGVLRKLGRGSFGVTELVEDTRALAADGTRPQYARACPSYA